MYNVFVVIIQINRIKRGLIYLVTTVINNLKFFSLNLTGPVNYRTGNEFID